MKKTEKKQEKRLVCANGFMTFDMIGNGLRTADFDCCDDVKVKPFIGLCRVQIMRDGNVYMTEQPKRIRNKPRFRDDNCSLSLGRDGKWYFLFTFDNIAQLPYQLIRQASSIARKVLKEIIFKRMEA